MKQLTLLTLAFFLMGSSTLFAPQDITGSWEGRIMIAGQTLDMRVHFEEGSDGLAATIDIPAQGASGLPLQNVRYEDRHVHFELQAGPGLAVFDGQMQDDGTLAGTFTQAAFEGTFELVRKAEVPASPTALAQHQAVLGRWSGAITAAGQQIPFAVEFMVEGDALNAHIDIQGAKGLPLQNVSHTAPTVRFELAAGLGLVTMEGRLKDRNTIAGSFKQGGAVGTFEMTREADADEGQDDEPEDEPEDLQPYDEEEVVFYNGDIKLTGTLSLPSAPGPHPAVILISGSGAQDRDADILGFKVFATLADHLTRNGIAVLRYDDRGTGGSSGNIATSTSADFAHDVLAAAALLKTHAHIDKNRIGLLGHSEGGLVAPLAATQSEDIHFIILLAGPSVPGSELLYRQKDLVLMAHGASAERIALGRQVQTAIFEALRTDQWDAARDVIRKEFEMALEAQPEEALASIPDREAFVKARVEGSIAAVKTPWFRAFVSYDPAPALAQVQIPVLALFGGLDLQVPADLNEQPMTEALDKAGNTDYTIKIFPDANHLFQQATTGSPEEYASLAKAFTPGFLAYLTSWIQDQASTAP